MNNWKDKFNIF